MEPIGISQLFVDASGTMPLTGGGATCKFPSRVSKLGEIANLEDPCKQKFAAAKLPKLCYQLLADQNLQDVALLPPPRYRQTPTAYQRNLINVRGGAFACGHNFALACGLSLDNVKEQVGEFYLSPPPDTPY